MKKHRHKSVGRWIEEITVHENQGDWYATSSVGSATWWPDEDELAEILADSDPETKAHNICYGGGGGWRD